jgi:hypothetical protein
VFWLLPAMGNIRHAVRQHTTRVDLFKQKTITGLLWRPS